MPAALIYRFGPFELHGQSGLLLRDGVRVTIGSRHVSVLTYLVANAGVLLSKNDIIDAVWQDVAVSENSLEQSISVLRRLLGESPDGGPYLETIPRQGYRFVAAVSREAERMTDEQLTGVLAPYRRWYEGVAALETLVSDRVGPARVAFEEALASMPDYAPAHVGLANACVMQFEAARVDAAPDRASLDRAVTHAMEACRLDSRSGEASATLGFVLARAGRQSEALAASRRATVLEPANWRHHLRLASVAWGEERLRAARRTLELMPGSSLAHWLAATVLVARQTLDDAEREVEAGIAGHHAPQSGDARLGGVALYWQQGLLRFARGDTTGARAAFERELAFEPDGHLYARECCANTWYAIGAMHLGAGERADAAKAFGEALARVPAHPLARLGLAAARDAHGRVPLAAPDPRGAVSADAAMVHAAALVLNDAPAEAADVVAAALAAAPPGSAGWVLPIEPLLGLSRHPGIWDAALSRLRTRAG